MRFSFTATTLLVFGLMGTAYAGPIDDADALYDKGDFAGTLKIVKPLAEQGNPAALFRLAVMLEGGRGVPKDLPGAMLLYQKSAQDGYADAQNSLGFAYLTGGGVEMDRGAAEMWFGKAAAQGNSYGHRNLSAIYAGGLNGKTDPVKAYIHAAQVGAPKTGKDTAFLTAPNPVRDAVAATLMPEQLKIAKEKAKACFLSQYKKCD